MNYLFVKDFLDAISIDLKKISRKTYGELGHDDLLSEAYIYIHKFYDENHRYPAPLNMHDRSWILSRIHNHFVKWTDHHFRRSLRIDSLVNDDGETWNLDLPADEHSDPIVQLLFKEHSSHLEDLLKQSYSEAKAYVVAFGKFDFDKELLSRFLWITNNTLDNRCSRAITMVKKQRSLFDNSEVIDDSFNPRPGHEKAKGSEFSRLKQLPLRFLN